MPPRGRPIDPTLQARRCEQILCAASSYFAKEGYAEADLDVLAARLGIGKGTLYRYFPKKRALFVAAVERSLARLRAHVREAVGGEPRDLDGLRRAVRAHLGFYAAHPDLVELMLIERAEFHHEGASLFFQGRQQALVPWHRLFRRLIRAGVLRPMPVETMTTAISNFLYGALITHLLGNRTSSLSAQAEILIDVLLHGITVPPRAATPTRRPRRTTP